LLARFSPDHFDGVIAGVTLPRPSGLEILRHIHKQNPDIPVFLLCNEQTVQLAKNGVSQGALTYFLTSIKDLDTAADEIVGAFDLADETALEPDAILAPEIEPDTAEVVEPEINTTNPDTASMRLLRELIASTQKQTLTDTLQLLADASAQVLETEHAVVLLTQRRGLRIATAFNSEAEGEPVREFLERANDGFADRVASARKTLIDALPAAPGKAPQQFIGVPMLAREQVVGVVVAYPLADDETLNLANVSWVELYAAQGAMAMVIDRVKDENLRLSPIDPVSGILKREMFLEMADRELRRSWRYNHAMSLLILDIDRMSVINLEHGHAVGNLVLRQVATLCRSNIRSVDSIGRYEEDSFAILLPMIGRDGARVVAERLRVLINGVKLAVPKGSLSVTATFGVCSYPRDDSGSVFDLLNIAQAAQLAARRAGPNRIVLG
jgi:diguanylate cyclase (GGDEF)-like protein